jgi:DNA-binding LacI/PurR family transcriptional regulator
VQFNFLPERDALGYLDRLTHESAQQAVQIAFVPVSCPREVYRFFIERHLSAVVMGSVFPDTDTIPSLDGDYALAGELLVQYLVARGHRRIALVTYETWHPGENTLVESMNRQLAQAGLPADSLTVRSIPTDAPLFDSEVRRLLESADRPTALVFRKQEFAAAAERVAQSLGLRVPDDVLLVHEGTSAAACATSPYPHVVRGLSFRQSAATIGRMLEQHMTGKELLQRHKLIPFELREPQSLTPAAGARSAKLER